MTYVYDRVTGALLVHNTLSHNYTRIAIKVLPEVFKTVANAGDVATEPKGVETVQWIQQQDGYNCGPIGVATVAQLLAAKAPLDPKVRNSLSCANAVGPLLTRLLTYSSLACA